MKKIVFSLIIILLSWETKAQQPHFQQEMKAVEENNALLKAAALQRDAKQQEAHVGVLLHNPEVEGAYYWGSPVEIGKRWDLSVSQSFDMPSVIARKVRLRNLEENAAKLDYEVLRNRLMYETQQVCADLVYYSAVANLWDARTGTACNIVDLYAKRLAAGDCSILDYNRAQMSQAEVQRAAAEAVMNARDLMTQLNILTGKESYDFRAEVYEEVDLPGDFGEWYKQWEMDNPELRVLGNQVDMSEQQASLSRAEWLPEMSLGYASENVVGETFRGVTLGLTLPIWSQPRAAKAAKLHAQAAGQELQAQRLALYAKQECLFHHLYALRLNINNLVSAYERYGSMTLLYKALEAGEIELEQYLQQTDALIDVQLQILELRREFELGWLQLNAGRIK
ncbi:MAG: TolC family protein [Bacteroidales bacterium]|nr:TolC family protein [Bacteroidales bacterium]